MSPWYAKAIVLAASIAMVVIRAPHGSRSRKVKTVRSRKGRLEVFLLFVAWLSFFLPLVWIFKPIFRFADYPLHPMPFVLGVVCFVVGLWIFYRSHQDLGDFWSITLEVREQHRLITEGIYRQIRHPMYLGLFVYSLAQALALPN